MPHFRSFVSFWNTTSWDLEFGNPKILGLAITKIAF